MKKILLMLTLILSSYLLHAQTPTTVITLPGTTYVYIGSLTWSSTSTANSQKIITKILGGSWFPDSNGETVFYISNRGGLQINKTSLGSHTAGRLTLKAYQTGDITDFYIVPGSGDYTSSAISSYSFGHAMPSGPVTITTQSTTPTGTDITSSLIITPIMITDPAGNIGIGTETPDTKLAVAGTIHAKEVKVDLTGWPDYVFKPTYKLPTLTEVKAYIEKNQHLPEMPSEQEVAKNGINLGELVKLQTKKIEELTLYLIEKDQQATRLQGELDQIKQQLNQLTKPKTPAKRAR